MIFALVGNQNCGKTTLFNAAHRLQPARGQFPGCDRRPEDGRDPRREGLLRRRPAGHLLAVARTRRRRSSPRDFIINEKPDGIINIVDATNIERNLYLTLQLLELRVPMVLALNMMDEVRANGGAIDVQKMSEALGIPVVPISRGEGRGRVRARGSGADASRAARTLPEGDGLLLGRFRPCTAASTRSCTSSTTMPTACGVPARFAAAKLIEGDDDHAGSAASSTKTSWSCSSTASCRWKTRPGSTATRRWPTCAIRSSRASCRRPWSSATRARSTRARMKIDRILTGKYTAIPTFLRHHAAHRSGSPSTSIGAVAVRPAAARHRRADRRSWTAALTAYGINPVVHSLIIDGVFAGVGSVLSVPADHRDAVFLPVHSGGHRLHGARGLRHGQAPAQDRPVRAQHRADAHRLRLLGAGHHGHAHRSRPTATGR